MSQIAGKYFGRETYENKIFAAWREYRSRRNNPKCSRRATPRPVRAALAAAASGADGITAHLREDRRHMTDQDILRLTQEIELPLNLEMAATEEMSKLHYVMRRTPPV